MILKKTYIKTEVDHDNHDEDDDNSTSINWVSYVMCWWFHEQGNEIPPPDAYHHQSMEEIL